ncbi:MAG: hypothetical protein GY898_17970 [Proteobacteria bacterium]|nr:hypothetical protein [Pseudomonadota bacterium]
MGLHDPRLAWSLLLAPRNPWADAPPPWPSFVTDRFGDVALGRTDPIDEVVRGPFPLRALARDSQSVLSGAGDAIAVTAIARRTGELERHVPSDELRAEASAVALGGAALEEVTADLDAAGDWEIVGLVEVEAVLSEGIAEDLPDVPGWRELGLLRLHRAAGVGEGHAAWQAEGWFARNSERVVMDRRLEVLCMGHRARVPSLVDYGASALRWGAAARSAARSSRALQAVIADVRAATAASLAGESVQTQMLTARLERARASLAEVLLPLQERAPELRFAAERVLGDGESAAPDGALVEASTRADALADRVAALDAAGARWSDALRALEG